MEDSPRDKSSISVPIAIVIAGALVAAALFMTRSPSTLTNNSNTNSALGAAQADALSTEAEIAIKTISQTEHILCNPAAKLAIVEYSDTECPFCKSFHATMHQVADTYGKNGTVLWVYRQFPLEQLHPKAPYESEATECAAELGGNKIFWEYLNKIFEITPSNNGLDAAQLPIIAKDLGLNVTQFNTCLSSGKYTSLVQASYDEAVGAGGRGTPFSIFISSKPISNDARAVVQGLNDDFSRQAPGQDPPFTFSTDKLRISMSGALPYTMIQKIINTLLK